MTGSGGDVEHCFVSVVSLSSGNLGVQYESVEEFSVSIKHRKGESVISFLVSAEQKLFLVWSFLFYLY